MISAILFVLAGFFLLWQFVVAGLGFALMASGKVRSVKIGLAPGAVATVLAIVGVVLL